MNDFTNEPQLNKDAGTKRVYRKRSGADMPEHMAAVDLGVGDVSRDSIAHGTKRPPRVSMANNDLLLSVDKRLLNQSKQHRFFADREGRIERAKAAYWDFVTDDNGVNIVRSSRGTKMYLMSLEKEYYAEDNALKMKRYYDSINGEADKDLGISGLKSDTDKGRVSALESRISQDVDGY